MSLTTRYGLVAGTTALAIAGTAFGGAESDNDALAQIAELKQELAELKQQDGQDWLTEQRASEIRGIVQDVLADADTRTSLQNSGAMAGYNKGFFLASPDGNFKLNVQGFMQVRWTLNTAGDQNTRWGFENADTYLDFSGNVVDPSWKFKVRGNFANDEAGNSGNMGLSFAYIEKDLGDGLSVRVGQFRAPWLREELVDDPYQLGVDRSLFNASFTQGFSQGIQVGYESDAFRVAGYYGDGFGPGFSGAVDVPGVGVVNVVSNGYNTANTAWNQSTTKWSFAGRGEYKISGDWSTFDDFTSFRGEEGGMMVGVAVRGQKGAGVNNGFSLTDDAEIFGVTADFTWDFGGANLYAAFVYQSIEWGNQDLGGGATIDLGTSDQVGFMVQGGYFVTEEIEIFGRYEYVDYGLDQTVTVNPGGLSGSLADLPKFNGITLGANYFFAPNVKATVEWGYNFKSLTNLTPDLNNAGFRPDVAEINNPNQGNEGQWALRAQLQLLF
jgi:hypothetical protein